jgi:hypothetical protein
LSPASEETIVVIAASRINGVCASRSFRVPTGATFFAMTALLADRDHDVSAASAHTFYGLTPGTREVVEGRGVSAEPVTVETRNMLTDGVSR